MSRRIVTAVVLVVCLSALALGQVVSPGAMWVGIGAVYGSQGGNWYGSAALSTMGVIHAGLWGGAVGFAYGFWPGALVGAAVGM